MNRIIFAIVALFLTGTAMRAVQSPSGSWTSEADMPSARSAHAVVATARGIFAIGGTGRDGKPVIDVDRFDGTRWTREAALPGEGLNAPAAAAVGDSIYVIGGFGTTTNQPAAVVHRYDTSTRQWSSSASLPAPRGGHAAAVLNGRIHVIGGGNSVSTIDDHSVFDPATNTWTERARLPRRMGSPAAVVLDGRLYSIGGRSGPSDFGDVHIYDPAADSWSPGPPIAPRGTGGAAALDGTIYYLGGESQAKNTVLGEVLKLTRGARAWTTAPPMPTARNYARAAVFRGAIYTVGGSTEFGSSHSSRGSAVLERFRP